MSVTREDARDWMIDYRFNILTKYRSLMELKEHFAVPEQDLLEILCAHMVLLFLDENPQPIFDVYSVFDTEDLAKIIYGTISEIEAISAASRQDSADENSSDRMEDAEEQGYVPGLDHHGLSEEDTLQ